jgi:disulfide bond formation protein DsbB
MMKPLIILPTSRAWWLFLVILSLLLEGVALYYQYALDQLPCVLCIHVRMLVFALLLVGLAGLFFGRIPRLGWILMVVTTGLWAWMTERSYQLLGTERGWVMGECQMQSGLPQWLGLERWMPWLFEIHEPCGYTPYLLFKISMAEALIVMSALLLIFCLLVLLAGALCRNALRPRGCQ